MGDSFKVKLKVGGGSNTSFNNHNSHNGTEFKRCMGIYSEDLNRSLGNI